MTKNWVDLSFFFFFTVEHRRSRSLCVDSYWNLFHCNCHKSQTPIVWSKCVGFGETQLCTLINIILHKSMPLKQHIPKKAHPVKDRVFLAVTLGNPQLHSPGIKPVNIILCLAHAIICIQVRFHFNFDHLRFIK